MRFELLDALCCASALLCIASALAGRIPAAAASASASVACFLAAERLRGTGASSEDGDALQFLDNMLANYSDTASTVALVERSLNCKFAFYADARRAVSRFRLQPDARRAFLALLHSGSYALRGVAAAIVSRLEDGAPLRVQLAELKRHVLRRRGSESRGIASSAGALSIARLGSAVFFPAFAGISINILRLTSEMQGTATLGAPALVPVFAFFVLYTNTLNFKYSVREPAGSRLRKSLLSGAIAMLSFRLASLLSFGML